MTVLVVAGGVAAAMASGNGHDGMTYVPKLHAYVPNSKLAATKDTFGLQGHKVTARHANDKSPAESVSGDRIPAHMLPPTVPVPVSPGLIRVKNAWLVADGRTLVAVYAGAAGGDVSEGRIVIVRQNFQKGEQTIAVISLPGVGALEIVNAPTGAAVETSAQVGKLHFMTGTGASGTLDLADNTASVP